MPLDRNAILIEIDKTQIKLVFLDEVVRHYFGDKSWLTFQSKKEMLVSHMFN